MAAQPFGAGSGSRSDFSRDQVVAERQSRLKPPLRTVCTPSRRAADILEEPLLGDEKIVGVKRLR